MRERRHKEDVPTVALVGYTNAGKSSILRGLSGQHEIVVESMGGDTLEFEVSAKTGDGLETLLEGLQLQAEILELFEEMERPKIDA